MMEALTTTFEKLGIPANHEGIIQLSGSRRLTILNNPGVDGYHGVDGCYEVAIQICPNPAPETPEKESWWDLVTLQVFLDGETVILELPGFKEEKNGIIQRKRYLLETGKVLSVEESPLVEPSGKEGLIFFLKKHLLGMGPLVEPSEREGLIFFLKNNGMSEADSLPDQIEPGELLRVANTLIDLARCRDENGNPIEEKVIGLINLKQTDLLPTLWLEYLFQNLPEEKESKIYPVLEGKSVLVSVGAGEFSGALIDFLKNIQKMEVYNVISEEIEEAGGLLKYMEDNRLEAAVMHLTASERAKEAIEAFNAGKKTVLFPREIGGTNEDIIKGFRLLKKAGIPTASRVLNVRRTIGKLLADQFEQA